MIRMLMIFAVGMALAGTTIAAPIPAVKSSDGTGPQIVGQALSLDRGLDLFRTGLRQFAPKRIYDQFDQDLKRFERYEDYRFIDFTKPFGMYGRVEEKFVTQLEEFAHDEIEWEQFDHTHLRLVFMVPIRPERLLLHLLSRRVNLEIKPVVGKPGIYAVRELSDKQVEVEAVGGARNAIERKPDGPTAFVKLHKNYLYVSLFSTEPLEGKQLLEPAEVIDSKLSDTAVVRVYPERIAPKVLEVLRRTIDYGERMLDAEEALPVGVKTGTKQLLNLSRRWSEMLLQQTRVITLHLSADAPRGMVLSRLTVEPKPGSAFAAMVQQIPASVTNSFGSLIGPESVCFAAQSVHLNIPDLRQALVKMLEAGKVAALNELIAEGTPQEQQDLASEAIDGVTRTLLGGQIDGVVELRGPDANGKYVGVMAVTYKDARKIENALRKAAPTFPADLNKALKLDAGKIDGVSYHTFLLPDPPEEVRRLFGKSPQCLFAFGENAIYVAIGPNAESRLKDALNAKPVAMPMTLIAGNGKKLSEVAIQSLLDPTQKQLVGFQQLAKLVAAHDRLTLAKLDITGGNQLTIALDAGVGAMLLPEIASMIERMERRKVEW